MLRILQVVDLFVYVHGGPRHLLIASIEFKSGEIHFLILRGCWVASRAVNGQLRCACCLGRLLNPGISAPEAKDYGTEGMEYDILGMQ